MTWFADKLGPAPDMQAPISAGQRVGQTLKGQQPAQAPAPHQRQAAPAPQAKAAPAPKPAPEPEPPKKKKGWF